MPVGHIARSHLHQAAPVRAALGAGLKRAALVAAVGSAVLLSGCANWFKGDLTSDLSRDRVKTFFSPYRMDVVQGNFISKEQVDFLKPGMGRAQVRDVLGTPLASSLFQADRWDYVFSYYKQGQPLQTYRLAVFFKGDDLERFEGDTMPSEVEFVSRLEARKALGKIPVLEASPEQLKKFAPSTPPSAAPAAEAPVPSSYPPLER